MNDELLINFSSPRLLKEAAALRLVNESCVDSQRLSWSSSIVGRRLKEYEQLELYVFLCIIYVCRMAWNGTYKGHFLKIIIKNRVASGVEFEYRGSNLYRTNWIFPRVNLSSSPANGQHPLSSVYTKQPTDHASVLVCTASPTKYSGAARIKCQYKLSQSSN